MNTKGELGHWKIKDDPYTRLKNMYISEILIKFQLCPSLGEGEHAQVRADDMYSFCLVAKEGA